jgi:hypothetical protein
MEEKDAHSEESIAPANSGVKRAISLPTLMFCFTTSESAPKAGVILTPRCLSTDRPTKYWANLEDDITLARNRVETAIKNRGKLKEQLVSN